MGRKVFIQSRNRFIFIGKVIIFLGLTILISHCLPKDKKEDPSQDNTEFTVMTNANDPQILSAKTSTGEIVNVFGVRDDKGIPKRIDQIVVTDRSKTEQVYFLDESARPAKIFADNGTTFYLKWLSEKRFALTVIADDRITQINTEVDLTNEQKQPKSLDIESKNQAKRNGELKLSFRSLDGFELENGKSIKSELACNLFVKQCGLAADADVWIDMRSIGTKELLRRIYPSRINTGVYKGNIPNDFAPSNNLADICQSIASLLDNLTIMGEAGLATFGVGLCYQLNMALTPRVSAAAAAKMQAACTKIVAGLLLYSVTLGSSVAPGAPSLASQLCDALFLNASIDGNVELTGGVRAFPSDKLSAKLVAPAQGPYPDLVIDLGNKTVLNSFTLIPSTPGYDQDYNAIANVSCLQPGTKITISVIGNDGYTKEISYTIKEYFKNGEFDLTVLGGDIGVRDTCTVKIELPDGTVLTMTASLVFG